MARSDTKARIQAVARDLFMKQGVAKTSLREIADALEITKPALYYHFASREDLVRSIVQPLIDDMESFLAEREPLPPPAARALVEDYFDLIHRHRAIIVMMVRDLSTLDYLDLGTRMFEWRRRLMVMLLGPDPTLSAQVRGVVAIGGMSDCTVEFAHLPVAEVRPLAVEAACSTLGIPYQSL